MGKRKVSGEDKTHLGKGGGTRHLRNLDGHNAFDRRSQETTGKKALPSGGGSAPIIRRNL